MSTFKCALPLLMLVSFFSGQSDAATFYKTTYRVQVQYEMWRNGSTYWDTEFESADLAEAQMVLSLFQAALDNGSLNNLMNCGPEWIAVDVRMTTHREYYTIKEPVWSTAPLIRR